MLHRTWFASEKLQLLRVTAKMCALRSIGVDFIEMLLHRRVSSYNLNVAFGAPMLPAHPMICATNRFAFYHSFSHEYCNLIVCTRTSRESSFLADIINIIMSESQLKPIMNVLCAAETFRHRLLFSFEAIFPLITRPIAPNWFHENKIVLYKTNHFANVLFKFESIWIYNFKQI